MTTKTNHVMELLHGCRHSGREDLMKMSDEKAIILFVTVANRATG